MNRSRVTGDLASHGNIFVDIANDRVGIGSTLPTNKLDIRGVVESRSAVHFHESLWTGETTKIQLQAGYLHIEGGSNGTIFRRLAGGNCWAITGAGHLQAQVDSSFDIGTNAVRVRNIYADTLYGDGSNLTGIANGNIASNAAISGFKISPNFGAQNIQTTGQLQLAGALPTILLNDENNENDFEIRNENGNFKVRDIDNPQDRYVIASSGMIHTFHGTASFSSTLTIGGELNLIGSSDAAKYIDARVGTSNNLNFRSTSGGDSNHVTMMSLNTSGASITGDLSLGDGTADSAAGPEFKLNRNSASPANADYLGQIKFAGRSSTGLERNYAKITGKILDVTNGSEDGILEFSHIKNGSETITGRWRSDSLQLLNGTNLSVNGTSTFEDDATFSGGAGAVTVGGGSDIRLTEQNNWTGNAYGKIQHHSNCLYFGGGSSTEYSFIFRYFNTDRIYIRNNGTIYPAGDSTSDLGKTGTRWANVYADYLVGDGSSISNVNATTLDSIDSGSFLRSDATDSASGSISFTNTYYEFGNSTGSVSNNGGWHARVNLAGTQHARLDLKSVSDGIITTMYAHTGQAAGKVGTMSDHKLQFMTNGSTRATLSTAGSLDTTVQGTLWGASNDGSGSGLDADTLDSVQGSSFLRSDATDTCSGQITHTNKVIIDHNSGTMLELKPQNSSPWVIGINRDDLDQSRVFVHNTNGLGWVFEHRPKFYNSGSYNNFLTTGDEGSGNGLDADTVDGFQTSQAGGASKVLVSQSNGYLHIDNWIRVAQGSGLFVQSGQHLFSGPNSSYKSWRNRSDDANACGIGLESSQGTVRAWVYANSSQVGFLRPDNEDWMFRVENTGITKLGSNGYQFINGNNSRNLYFISGDSSSGTDVGISGFNGANQWRFQLYGAASGYGFLDANWNSWDIKKVPSGNFEVDEGSGLARVWNSLNDGSGSGLDADLLDGVQGSSYLRSDADDTMSEKLTFTQNGQTEFLKTPGNVTMHSVNSGDNALILRNLGQLRFEDGSNWNYNEWAGIKFVTSSDIMYIGGPASSQFTNNGGAANINVNFVGVNNNGLQKDGNTVWHAGNDGSGSGLDADTVDGTHVAELVTTNTTQTIAATKTFNLSGYDINLDYDNVRNLVRIQRQGTEKFMLGAAGNEIKINTSNSGFLSFGTSLLPQNDGSVDLGSSSKRWANLYTADAHFSNVGTGGNDIDGTEGSWTLQEAEDNIYMINKKNGKRYKIKMEEV